MTYEEFYALIVDKIRENKASEGWDIRVLQDGYTSEDGKELENIRSANLKYNHIESDVLKGDFIIMSKPGELPVQTHYARFSIDYLYSSYLKNGWENVHKIISSSLKYACIVDQELMGHLDDYDAVKDRIIIRAINYSDNRLELKDKVYRVVGDIALTLYGELGEFDENYMTFKLYRSNLDSWGITKDEAIDYALANTNVLYPPRIYPPTMLDFKNVPYTEGAFMALNSKITRLTADEAPLLTCTSTTNGSTGFFYPGVKERLAELYDDDYYVVFTAVTEAHIHKVGSVNPRELLAKLKHCNRMFPEDMLSRKIYRYSREKKELIALVL